MTKSLGGKYIVCFIPENFPLTACLSVQVRTASRRLQAAAARSTEVSKRLGPRTQAALETLLCSDSAETAVAAVEAMAWGTTYSRSACQWIVNGGGIPALVKFLGMCQRTKLHQSMLNSILKILSNLLSYSEAALPLDRPMLATLVDPLTNVLWRFRCDHPADSLVQHSPSIRTDLSLETEQMAVPCDWDWSGVCAEISSRSSPSRPRCCAHSASGQACCLTLTTSPRCSPLGMASIVSCKGSSRLRGST